MIFYPVFIKYDCDMCFSDHSLIIYKYHKSRHHFFSNNLQIFWDKFIITIPHTTLIHDADRFIRLMVILIVRMSQELWTFPEKHVFKKWLYLIIFFVLLGWLSSVSSCLLQWISGYSFFILQKIKKQNIKIYIQSS